MRTLLSAAVLLASLALPGTGTAQSCGFRPFPPLPPPGCHRMEAVCVCDESGCHWVWYCAG